MGVKEPNIIVAGFAAPLSFLNAYHFRQNMLNVLQSSTSRAHLIVLEATGILDIDFTAAQILRTSFGGAMRMASRSP
jgi:sulfate permease, SulP family